MSSNNTIEKVLVEFSDKKNLISIILDKMISIEKNLYNVNKESLSLISRLRHLA